jgi:AcrR family transcriptional regulator
MSDTEGTGSTGHLSARRRLTKEERHAQLLDVSWRLVGEEGTDALTLGRLAEVANVSKPLVYNHFETREGLLTALYRDFDAREAAIFDAAVAASQPNLDDKIRVVVSCYIECVLTEGRELPGVLDALSGSPELNAMKNRCRLDYIEKCRKILSPFAGAKGISVVSLLAFLGAADALSNAILMEEIEQADAHDELQQFLITMIERSG